MHVHKIHAPDKINVSDVPIQQGLWDKTNDTASMQEFDCNRSSPPVEISRAASFFSISAAEHWEAASTKETNAANLEVDSIRRVVNTRFNLRAKPWQVSLLIDICKQKRDVCVLAGTNAGKSLTYQAVPVVTNGIVLVISPTIALMDDQSNAIKKIGLTVATLTRESSRNDPGLWHRVDCETYDIVFASPEIILGSQSWFWKMTVRNRKNKFIRRLRCIAIDEAHFIWGWREFRGSSPRIFIYKQATPSPLFASNSAEERSHLKVVTPMALRINLCHRTQNIQFCVRPNTYDRGGGSSPPGFLYTNRQLRAPSLPPPEIVQNRKAKVNPPKKWSQP